MATPDDSDVANVVTVETEPSPVKPTTTRKRRSSSNGGANDTVEQQPQPTSDAQSSASSRRSKRQRTASSEAPPASENVDATTSCKACHSTQTAPTDRLLHCGVCALTVHAGCYGVGLAEDAEAPWTCDRCRLSPAVASTTCVFCHQEGDECMRHVDSSHWPTQYQSTHGGEWAHVDCALWDPFGPKPATPVTTTSIEPETPVDTEPVEGESATIAPSSTETAVVVDDLSATTHPKRLLLPVPACHFCHKDVGVRLQCRHLHCGRFFHVRCALTPPGRGCVQVSHIPFRKTHLYCDRHRQAHPDLDVLITKLSSKSIASSLPRDIVTKALAIARRPESFATIDAYFSELVAVFVDLCKRGLQASKADPPRYVIKHMQALQLVLDHLPQLRTVYTKDVLSKSESDFVNDAELFQTLQRTFAPQRYVRKFAGPLSQFHQCDACKEPFQERQHVFYCTSAEQPHALHWRCTKRKSSAKESRANNSGGSNSKNKNKAIKSVSLVVEGHWRDTKLPKGLPNMSDGVTCGVCRAPVDARGIIAGRKDVTKVDFEKPTSAFMFGGCFANEMDARSAAAAGLRTSRATARKAGTVKSIAAPAKRSGAAIIAGDGDGSDSNYVLGPPKMERINVRRTTRWLACLGQVIRVVMEARKQEKMASAVSKSDDVPTDATPPNTTDAQEPTQPTVTAEASNDEPLDGNLDKPSDEGTGPVESTQSEAPSTASGDSVTPTDTTDTASSIGTTAPPTAESATVNVKDETMEEPKPVSSLPPVALAYLEEAMNVVRPYDAYALQIMENAHRMLEERRGPGLSLLNTLIQEYTRFMYIKHTRAVEKASNEKRKRLEQAAEEEREQERKRIDREAELALKKQMQAMRNKPRQ